MKVEIYSKSNCPNCDAAKALVKQKGVEYTEKSVDKPEVFTELLARYPQARQMPQIWINDQRVGGIDGLKAAFIALGL